MGWRIAVRQAGGQGPVRAGVALQGETLTPCARLRCAIEYPRFLSGGSVSKRPEMATISCANCGLHGHLEREEGGDAMCAFLDDNAFTRLCKSQEAGSAADCPHWDEACRAAVPHLKAQSAH